MEIKETEKVEKHYETVSKIFNIEHNCSFMAWSEPCIRYSYSIEENPQMVKHYFPKSKILHFHTCGDYAPGEIC